MSKAKTKPAFLGATFGASCRRHWQPWWQRASRRRMPLPRSKKMLIDATAEMVAAAVKDDFLKFANSEKSGVSFYGKEAEFMSKVFGL